MATTPRSDDTRDGIRIAAARLPGPADRRAFTARGCLAVEGLWDDRCAAALAHEAGRLLPRGRRAGPGGPERPSRQAVAADAPLLARLHRALVPLARALAGRLLVPTCAWYNYYEQHDGIWLHIDIDASELALLTTVLGEVGPLHLHPALRGRTQDQLDALQRDPDWDCHSGTAVRYPCRGVLAQLGRAVPHHRPGRPLARPGAVAALHYRSPF
ncbi:hypothetical protein [Streptomyces ehimensis]|uniref:Uncharacterized protein n=1 Tax=Streptomyces ehimensis TaxID=68195 RepID=A0ABV9BJD6_9ACTN